MEPGFFVFAGRTTLTSIIGNCIQTPFAFALIFTADMNMPVWTIKLFKFTSVGIIGACIDFSITYLLKEKAKWNKFIASSIGFCVGIINNFFLNRAWTFAGVAIPLQVEFGKFCLVSIVGLGINNLSVYIMHEKLHINFYLAKALTVVFVVSWNFTANYLFTFK